MGGMKVSNMDFIKLLPAFMQDDEAAIALSKAVNKLIGEPGKRLVTIRTWDKVDELTEAECNEMAWELDIDWYYNEWSIDLSMIHFANFIDLFYSFIFCKYILKIEICLFIRLSCFLPIRILFQIREPGICLIYMICPRNIRYITIRKHCTVNTFSADHKDFSFVLFTFLHCLFHTVYYDRILHMIIRIVGNHDINPVGKRTPLRKAFQCLSSHHDNIAFCHLTEVFHICRDSYKQTVILSYCPVFICIYNNVHRICLLF